MLAEVEEEKTLFALILVNAYKLSNKYIFCFGIPFFSFSFGFRERNRWRRKRREKVCERGGVKETKLPNSLYSNNDSILGVTENLEIKAMKRVRR